jgi:hypothetical protein
MPRAPRRDGKYKAHTRGAPLPPLHQRRRAGPGGRPPASDRSSVVALLLRVRLGKSLTLGAAVRLANKARAAPGAPPLTVATLRKRVAALLAAVWIDVGPDQTAEVLKLAARHGIDPHQVAAVAHAQGPKQCGAAAAAAPEKKPAPPAPEADTKPAVELISDVCVKVECAAAPRSTRARAAKAATEAGVAAAAAVAAPPPPEEKKPVVAELKPTSSPPIPPPTTASASAICVASPAQPRPAPPPPPPAARPAPPPLLTPAARRALDAHLTSFFQPVRLSHGRLLTGNAPSTAALAFPLAPGAGAAAAEDNADGALLWVDLSPVRWD